jgi:hypothetical protein
MRVVVIADEEEAAHAAAAQLQAQLVGDPRLKVSDVAVVSHKSRAEVLDLAAAQILVREAQEAYAHLEPQAALVKLDQAEAALGRWADVKEARLALAHALRLRGLTLLFVEKSPNAGESFGSAWLLDPEFSPAAEEWPPEARLAYADAIAAMKRGGVGSLTVTVTPRTAQVFVDGREVGLGATTVSDLAAGPHQLLVVVVGHKRSAVTVEVHGGGKLDTLAVFPEPFPETERRREALAAIAAALDGPREAVVAVQGSELLEADALILVRTGGAGTVQTGGASALVLEASGKRLGAAVSLVDIAASGRIIVDRLFGVAPVAQSPLVPSRDDEPSPWYLRWYALATAGAVVVGSGVALGILLTRSPPDRITFIWGRE